MSSTNKTANLTLPQWENTDPVNMEDFNAAFSKLDEAVGNRLELKLLRDIDMNLGDNRKVISIDISDIDFNDYMVFLLSLDKLSSGVLHIYESSNSECGQFYDGDIFMGFPLRNTDRQFAVILFHAVGTMATYSPKVKYSVIKSFNLVAGSSFPENVKVRLWGVK